tara:strand:+ start:65 stop:352 length:288 start_codon:yes stop_codon:yes gene_type:complete
MGKIIPKKICACKKVRRYMEDDLLCMYCADKIIKKYPLSSRGARPQGIIDNDGDKLYYKRGRISQIKMIGAETSVHSTLSSISYRKKITDISKRR